MKCETFREVDTAISVLRCGHEAPGDAGSLGALAAGCRAGIGLGSRLKMAHPPELQKAQEEQEGTPHLLRARGRYCFYKIQSENHLRCHQPSATRNISVTLCEDVSLLHSFPRCETLLGRTEKLHEKPVAIHLCRPEVSGSFGFQVCPVGRAWVSVGKGLLSFKEPHSLSVPHPLGQGCCEHLWPLDPLLRGGVICLWGQDSGQVLEIDSHVHPDAALTRWWDFPPAAVCLCEAFLINIETPRGDMMVHFPHEETESLGWERS